MTSTADRQSPLVPHVVYAQRGQDRPYTIATIERCVVRYHTATTVRVQTSTGLRSVQQYQVWVLPDDATWQAVQLEHGRLQAALTALRTELEQLGTYMQRRDELGMDAPNPISTTVINAPAPDRGYVYLGAHWYVPGVERYPIERHTPKMLWVQQEGRYGPVGASGWWYCPDDTAWQRVHDLHTTARVALQLFEQFLRREVGTYQDIVQAAAFVTARRAA